MNLPERCRRIEASPVFGRAVLGVILFAGVLVGLETSAQVTTHVGPLLVALDRLVLGLFVLEISLKLVARWPRPLDFFRDGWNVFDFGIVALCLLPIDGRFLTVLRLVRVLRVFRLITSLPRLRILVGALFRSVPSMGYIGLLLLLLFYVYAVIGTFKFGPASPEHFGSLPRSFLTLFQVVTLEGWAEVMEAQRARWPLLAPLYFVSFILLGTMIALNLLIGVIINSMSEAQGETAAGQLANVLPGTTVKEELAQLEQQMEGLGQRLARLRSSLPDEGAP